MAYFKMYPTIEYDGLTVVDIMRKVVIEPQVIANTSMWKSYVVKDGEYPEDVAYNFYGSSERVDLILLMNNIIDPFYGWVLSSTEFNAYLEDKYADRNGIHHYEIDDVVVRADEQGAVSVTNYQYEFDKNEAKRYVRILNSDYLATIMDEMKSKLHSNTRDGQTWQ